MDVRPSKLATLFVVAALCASCARMATPPGGPEDKTAPTVVKTSPTQDETEIAWDRDVMLEFSEPVNRSGVEAALYLSPEPGQRLRYRWSGRRLVLDYLDPLPDNRTIVVTVGAQAKDLQGNGLESSFTLAFSTGDSIDRGLIRGMVALPEKSKSFGVVAYLLSDTLPDPLRDSPDYRMQTDADGSFELTYLAQGRYRLFALDDRNFDGLWSPASELIGPASMDVDVREGLTPFVTFVPMLHDTSPPAILRARQFDQHRLDLRLNKDMQPTVLIRDGAAEIFAEHIGVDSSASGSWFVYFGDTLTSDSALVTVGVADDTLAAKFAVNSRADTTAPSLVTSWPANRSVNRELPEQIIAVFSEPILFDEPRDSLTVTFKADTVDVPFSVSSSDPASISVTPDHSLIPGKKYTLEIPGLLIRDYSGNVPHDSVVTIAWYTYPADSMGTISGSVRATAGAQWILELHPVKDRVEGASFTTFSSYEFRGWPEGKYRIRILQDVNRDGVHNIGSVMPFEFSEPFQWHPDTVSVRPRWTNETDITWTTETQR
ncbi:MAG: Ig-like domain-containing protein [bacterium]|nr:Ig-like domain-containing protein [bacterium]